MAMLIAILAAVMFAQAQEVTAGNALFAYGPMGIMLCWFLVRFESIVKEVRGVGTRIDGLAKAILVDVLSRDTASDRVRALAHEQLQAITARDIKRSSAD